MEVGQRLSLEKAHTIQEFIIAKTYQINRRKIMTILCLQAFNLAPAMGLPWSPAFGKSSLFDCCGHAGKWLCHLQENTVLRLIKPRIELSIRRRDCPRKKTLSTEVSQKLLYQTV